MENLWLYVGLGCIALALLGALTGLWKGVYKTTFKFLVMGALCLVLVFMMPSITNWVCALDISTFWGGFDISINGITYHFGVVDEVLIKIITDLELVSSVSTNAVYTSALALSHALISFVIYIVGIILIIIIGPLVSSLLYHCAFKFIIPKTVRKKHKLRLVSMFEGLIGEAVIIALFLSPFTSLISAVSRNDDVVSKIKDSGLLPEQYNQYIDLIMTYDDSALYKTMSLGNEDPTKALDTSIMSNVTKVIINGETYYIYDEINNIISVLPTVIDSVSSNSGSMANATIDMTKLLSYTSVDAILTAVSSSNLLMNLLPAFISIGLSNVNIEADGQSLDFSNVNWSDQFTALSDMYGSLYDSGLITSAMSMFSSGDKVFRLDLSKKADVKEALSTFNGNNVISKNLPVLMAYYAKTLKESNGINYLSTSPEVYSTIDFGTELCNLVDVFYGICSLVFTPDSDGLVSIKLDDLGTITQKLMEVLNDSSASSFKLVKTILLGGEYENTETSSTDNYVGLFNSGLFETNAISLNKLLSSLISSLGNIGSYFNDKTIDLIASYISNKDEMSLLLEAIPKIMSLGSDIDITKEESRTNISNILKSLEGSKIVSSILPNFICSKLESQKDTIEGMLFGLTLSDFDFLCKDNDGKSTLVAELNSLFNVIGDGLDISSSLKNSTDSSALFKNLDTTKLKNVLVSLYNNKIINPDKVLDGTNKVSNDNFSKFVGSALSQDSLKSSGIVIPSDLSKVSWYSKSGSSESGEIINLIDAIDNIKENTYLVSGSLDFNTISSNSDKLKTLFESISKSVLLSSSLPSLLNDNVAPLVNSMFGANSDVAIDFNNVTDWGEEADSLVKILKQINDLSTSLGYQVDFSNIDWASLDQSQMSSLLKAVASSRMFGVTKNNSGYYVDVFGKLLSTVTNDFISPDLIGESLDPKYFTSVSNSITGATKEDDYWGAITNGGEIDKLATMISNVNAIGASKITSGELTGDDLKLVLLSILDTRTYSSIVSNVLTKACSNISIFDGTSYKISLGLINATNELITKKINGKYVNVEGLCEIFGDKDKLSNITSSGFDDATINDLALLLNKIAENDLLITVKIGEKNSFFTELMTSIVSITTLDKKITGINGDTADNQKSRRDAMLVRISSMDKNDWCFTSTTLNEWSTYVKDKTTANFKCLEANSKAETSEILRIMNILKVLQLYGTKNGDSSINFDSLGSFEDLAPSAVENLLYSINSSHVFHAAVPSIFGEIFTSINIDNLISLDSSKPNKVNYNVHKTSSTEDIEYWQSEIGNISDLFDKIRNAKNNQGNKCTDLSSIDLGHNLDTNGLYNFIGPISKLDLLSPYKHIIVYKLINNENAGTGDNNAINFIRGNTPLQKSLVINSQLFNQGSLKDECDTMDSLINTLNGDSVNGRGETAAGILFNLIMNTFYGTELNADNSLKLYKRGVFSQELVSGFITKVFTADTNISDDPADKLDISNFFNSFFKSEQISSTDFQSLNIIEARGIKGLLTLADPTFSFDTISEENKAKIVATFALMGRKSVGSVSDETTAEYKAMLTYVEGKTSSYPSYVYDYKQNSAIATKLFDKYAATIMVSSGKSLKYIVDTYNNYNPANPIVFGNTPFETIGERIVSVL